MVVRLFSRKMQKAVVAVVSQPFETVEKGLREIGVADGW